MKVRINGELIEADEVKIYAEGLPSVCGITEESDLEITITEEGIIADLWEVTDRCNGSSCEGTLTFGNTFEEFVELLK